VPIPSRLSPALATALAIFVVSIECSGGDTTTREDAVSVGDTPLAQDTATDTAVDDTHPGQTETTDDVVDASDVVSCEYLDERLVATCAGALRILQRWTDASSAGCPEFYSSGAARSPTLASLAADLGCSTDCVYVPVQTVEVHGCDSGTTLGYDLHEAHPSEGITCIDAVFVTPDGVLTDLCAWRETSCSAPCRCADGDLGEALVAQLSGASGTQGVSVPPHITIAQTVTVPTDGVLTAVELGLANCTSNVDVLLTVSDEGTAAVLATGRLSVASVPSTCFGFVLNLDLDTPGAGVFDLFEACAVVSSGQTLVLTLHLDIEDAPPSVCEGGVCVGGRASGSCQTAVECVPRIGVGVDGRDPYPGGALMGFPDRDLAFKVFMHPLAP